MPRDPSYRVTTMDADASTRTVDRRRLARRVVSSRRGCYATATGARRTKGCPGKKFADIRCGTADVHVKPTRSPWYSSARVRRRTSRRRVAVAKTRDTRARRRGGRLQDGQERGDVVAHRSRRSWCCHRGDARSAVVEGGSASTAYFRRNGGQDRNDQAAEGTWSLANVNVNVSRSPESSPNRAHQSCRDLPPDEVATTPAAAAARHLPSSVLVGDRDAK